MMTVKVQCACGQRYAFDVEAMNGRMTSAVACPVCGADGTAAANAIIAQNLAAVPPPSPAPHRLSMPVSAAAPITAAIPPAPVAADIDSDEDEDDSAPKSEADTWKWWYFVLAGICIGAYSIWSAYNKQSIKPLGELFLAVFCIAVGIWDFQHKRAKKRRKKLGH